MVNPGLDEELSDRDRLNALETVLNRVEPKFTLTGKNFEDMTDTEAELVIRKLEYLTPEQLEALRELALEDLMPHTPGMTDQVDQ